MWPISWRNTAPTAAWCPRASPTTSRSARATTTPSNGQSDNPYLDFITPEIVESFCVLGQPEDHVTKLNHLKEAGMTHFNIYLDNGDEENIIAQYGEHIIPRFRD